MEKPRCNIYISKSQGEKCKLLWKDFCSLSSEFWGKKVCVCLFVCFFKMTIITIEIFNRPLELLLPSAGAQSWCYKKEVHRQIARRRAL